uniref:DNA-(apurinic or apyrimidinic site) endonuclease n=1 Tax=Neospora caninum (strain Liverpool) TaxID=572307 RepID=A0A0F7UQA1_NEOCL|nr:TPA: exonuclease III APE [Neospora caninum Liverpool]
MRPLGFVPSFVHADSALSRSFPLAESPFYKFAPRRLALFLPFASPLSAFPHSPTLCLCLSSLPPSLSRTISPSLSSSIYSSLSPACAYPFSRLSTSCAEPSSRASGGERRRSPRRKTATMPVQRAQKAARGEEEAEGPPGVDIEKHSAAHPAFPSSSRASPSGSSVSVFLSTSIGSALSCSEASPSDGPQAKEGQQRKNAEAEREREKRQEQKRTAPLSIVTWNVNSIASRIRDTRQWFYFSSFLQKVNPDILCLQEVKLAAHGPPGAKRGDGMPRDRSRIKESDKVSSVEAREIREALNTLLPDHKLLISLADWRYSGQMMFIRNDLPVRSLRYNLALDGRSAHEHDPEGRIILAEFSPFCVLTTYSPNNGGTPKSFERRRLWDERMLEFVTQLKKPLVWVGDLNCAPEDIDLSDPEQFRSVIHESADGTIDPDNIGQAGCTDAERRRFRAILERGNLVDAFRELHPRMEPPPLESAEYSWRGFGGSGPRGMLRGLGMRLDHIVLTATLMPAVELVRICGAGKSKANFFGSDHCPVLVRFKEKETLALPAVACEAVRVSASLPPAKKRQEDSRLDAFFGVKRRAPAPGEAGQKRTKAEEIVISDSSDEERKAASEAAAPQAPLENTRHVQAS